MKSKILTSVALTAMLASVAGCMTEKQKVEDSTFKETCGPRNVSVYFDQWEYQLNKPARNVINTLIKSLQGCRIDRVTITGLADATGDPQANLKVSKQRADTITNTLAKAGWPRAVFQVAAVGEAGAERSDGTMKPMRRAANIKVEASNWK